MKTLNRKVFISIFTILSLFLIAILIGYNVQTYKKEYENVAKNLNFMEEAGSNKPKPNKYENESAIYRPARQEIENMMIVDYEVYTIKLEDDEIVRIIGHSDYDSEFDIIEVADKIINKNKRVKIGNLYNSKYAYNHEKEDTIIVINTEPISKKLKLTLFATILFFIGAEILIYLLSLVITKWITKPAIDSFNKQKDFIADASHELKTPLAVIMASADELKSDKKNAKYVENIKYETERMNKLITSLLDLSKLENGVTIANYKVENLSKIVEKISLTFEAIAFENNITINTNINKDIEFKCSKEEIEKLISIIIDNAIKHSYKDSIVNVNLSKEKNNINIEIINEGDPIVPGDEEKIFERFYRADKSRKRNSNRYGLGLAIAKNIVTNHNGIIKAFSNNGKTTFKITFKVR